MSTIELAIKNFPAQQTIFDSKTRYKIAVKGRRFGLTKGAANDFIKCALEGTFKQGIWVDTVNQNIDRYVERYFLPHLNKIPTEHWNWRKQAKVLEIRNSYIDFRSVDRPENIEGFGYDKAFLNEAGIILKDEYLWNNAIRPMLWEFKPITVIGGTPKVGSPLFRELAARGEDPKQELYELFHFTTFDNPYLDKEEIEKEIQSLPERVREQEIYAKFLDDTGAVFRNAKEVATSVPQKPIPNRLYVMGVDLAKVEDWTVVTVYDRHTNQQVYQDRFQQLDWNFQKKKIKSIADMYNRAVAYIDATGLGDPIVDDLVRDGVSVEPFKLTNTSKKEIIEKAVIWFEQKKCSILNLEESIKEFNNFTYDVSSSGHIRYNAPQGFHDDIVIAHCLAIWGLNPIYEEEKPKEETRIQSKYRRLTQPRNQDIEFEYEITD